MNGNDPISTLNWLAVLTAAFSTFVLGGLWYGPLFGRAWMRASGITEEKAKLGNPGMIFGISFALQLVAAAVLGMFIGPQADLGFGLMAGGSAGLCWVASALGVIYLFEQRSLAHWTVNAGYCVVSFLLMGGILGAWH